MTKKCDFCCGTSKQSKNKKKSALYIYENESVYFPRIKTENHNIYIFKDKFFLSANHFLYIWSA